MNVTTKFGIGRGQAMAVQQQEGFADHRRNPLVAVDKGMVARQPIGVSSRQGSGIRLAIMGELLGPRHRAFEQASIAQRVAAPRDCQDFRVWPGIMGNKESHYVTTQRTCHTE